MQSHRKSPTVDAFEDDLRVRSVTVAVLQIVAVGFVIVAYCAFTWDRPHRPLMVALVAGALVLGIALKALPTERVIRGRWREPFFLSWSFSMVAAVSLLVVLDGTDESPLALTFVMPLIFAASSYPLASTLIVSVLDVAACLAVGLSDGGHDVSRPLVLTGMLAAAAFMCTLQARNHDRQREALKLVSRTDSLTGVLNRRGFEERLDAALRTGERSGEPVALLLLDLDGFKPVNDREGHAAGDVLLQWVAGRIEACMRPADVVGRIGGDEFAIVAPGADAEAARELAERIIRTLGERIGSSIGIADYPSDGTTADQLHRRADEGLYQAKRAKHPEFPPQLSPAVGRGPAVVPYPAPAG
jgi:diguanylate cyclase (GGDEF)-like protein